MEHRIDPFHEQGPYHWLLALDGLGSRSGTCEWPADESRYDLYLRIRSTVLGDAGRSDGPVPATLFFDIRPNHV